MKTFKKLFAYSAIFALLATMMPTYANAASYSEELTEAYGYAKNKGITTMTSIDNADMYGNLTRVAMAKMVANYVLDLGLQELDTTKECNFPDVSASLDAAYDNGVTKACQLGLMGVGIEKFNPNGIVTRAEFGTVLSRALWGDEYNDADPYYKDHLQALKDEGIMTKIDNPMMTEVRGYVMLMMMRADDNYSPATGCSAEELLACIFADDYESCIATCADEAEEEVLPGFATVSRVGSTTNQTVAKNAVAKKIGTVKLTAGENDTTVSSIVISKRGLANGSVKFFIEKDGIRVSPKATMSNNKTTVTVRFSPAITLKARGSETFDIVADFDAETNSQFEFSVSDVNVANGKSSGTPVSLGTVNTTSYTVGTINSGSIVLTKGDDQKAGDTNKLFASVQITLPTKETRFDGFVLTKESGKENLYDLVKNVKAYYNGEEIGKVSVDTEKIVVSDLNIVKAYAEQVTIELRSDCIYVGNSETFGLSIQDNDIIATETNTNERLATQGITPVNFTIAGVNLTADSLITAAQTVAPGTAGVELFKAKVSSNSTFDITNYTLKFDTSANVTSGNFTSLIAYVDGVDYDLDLDNGKNERVFTKDDAFTAPATIRVVGNLTANSTTGTTYKLTLTLNTGRNDSNVEISLNDTSVVGHSTTVSNGGFTLTRQADTPTNKTILEGSAEKVLFFKLRANAEDQILKKLVVKADGSSITTGLNEIVTRVDLMRNDSIVNDSIVKSITNASDLSGKTVTFSDLSERLAKDTDVNFSVKVTLKGGEVATLGKKVKFSITNPKDEAIVKVVRAVKQTVPTNSTSPAFVGTDYYIASNAPAVEITSQDAKNTFVKFTNNSSYYVELTGVVVEMTRNKAPGTAGYVAWSGRADFWDAVNGDAISTSGAVPGTPTLILDESYQNLDSTLNYVLKLNDPHNTITADDYDVIIKELEYRFVDKVTTKKSDWIKETYNVTETK